MGHGGVTKAVRGLDWPYVYGTTPPDANSSWQFKWFSGKDLWPDNGLDSQPQWGHFGAIDSRHMNMTMAITIAASKTATPTPPATSIHGAICGGRFTEKPPLVVPVGTFGIPALGVEATTGCGPLARALVSDLMAGIAPDVLLLGDLTTACGPDPVTELQRLYSIHDLLFGRTPPGKLVPLEQVQAEVTELLARVGYPGDPDQGLRTWAGMENLEERLHDGRIDPVVLRVLREQAAAG